jgi:hypothetical protein
MGIETRTTEIQGHKYELTLFGAKQGQRVLVRLGKCLGPAAAALLEKGSAGGVADAIRQFVHSLGEDDLDYLTEQFAGSCNVVLVMTTKAGPKENPQPLSKLYDHHFARRYPAMLAWLGWCISENYASFFDGQGLGALSDLVPDLSRFKHHQGLTPSSGESSQTRESPSD